MHAPDRILEPELVVTGFAVAGITTALVLRSLSDREIPRVAVVSSMFFVASLIHVPAFVPGASIHLVLNGVAGLVLGPPAFLAVGVGVVLQALLFGHGGVSTIGFNWCVMGIPALLASAVFRVGGPSRGWGGDLRAAVASGGAVLVSAMLLGLALWWSDREEFRSLARWVVLANLPVVVIESVVGVLVVRFLWRVQPGLLDGRSTQPASA